MSYSPTGAIPCITAGNCPNSLDRNSTHAEVRCGINTAAVTNHTAGSSYSCSGRNGATLYRYVCDKQGNKFCERAWSEAL